MISAQRTQTKLSPIIAINGLFLIILGATAATIGIGCKIFSLDNSNPFIISGMIIGSVGVLGFYLRSDGLHDEMSMRQILLSMISFWISGSIASTLPFMIGTPHFNFEFALFEAVSALTTTGATVMVGLDDMPESILLWRSILHWYGGMGIVIGAMVMFPAMRLGGMQFFLRKGSESEDKILPSARQLGIAVFGAYSVLTVICCFAYIATNVPVFDAVNLSMSTLATGGLAVRDTSFLEYADSTKLVASFFMILAGIPLVLHIRFLNGNIGSYWKDTQVRTYIYTVLSITALVTLYHIYHEFKHIVHDQPSLFQAISDSIFNSASILTGTGFTDGDYQLWGAFPTAILFMAMFIGGCTGSTTGAIKIFRFQILFEVIRSKIRSIIYPHAVAVPKYDGETIEISVIESITAFLLIYIASFALVTSGFAATGLDLISSLSASASSIGNVGPALGNQIGPVGIYAGFETPQLVLYILGMILGRLEFVVFMVLFLPRFWRH